MGRVLLIDENALFRFALGELVKFTQPACHIIEAETVTRGRELLHDHADVMLIMLDIRVPDCGGFGGIFRLQLEFPGVPIVVLSANAEASLEDRAAAFGVAGFISKSAPLATIAQALKKILPARLGRPASLSPIRAGITLSRDLPRG